MLRPLSLFSLLILQTAALTAQVVRVGGRPKPRALIGTTLTIAATPSTVSFALVSKGIALGSAPVTITTTWSGISLIASLGVYASFFDATAALSGGAPLSTIPSSCVLGRDPSGIPTTFTGFTQTTPFGGAGAGLTLFTGTGLISLGGNRTDPLSLEINLATLPQLPAGTYTGVLTLQAQAF